MCLQYTTIFKTCGCCVVELFARCAYYEHNFTECMNWTVVQDMPEEPGKCLKRDCKNPDAQPPAEVKEDKQDTVEVKMLIAKCTTA